MLELIAIGAVLVSFAYLAATRAVALATGHEAGAQVSSRGRQLGRIELGLYALLVIALLALAATGFAGYLTVDELRGLLLVGHMMAGGVFSVVLPIFLVVFAEAARFDRARRGPLKGPEKPLFWLAVAAGGVSMGTIVLTMLPVLDTHAMETMLTIHRYSGLVMLVLLAPHVYIMNTK